MKFIYLTTNLINGKRYIGQHTTENLNDGYLGSGVLLVQAIKKYGEKNFSREILCFCDTQDELDQKEKEFIAQFNAVEDDNFYNLNEGGQQGDGWRACWRWRETHPEQDKKLRKEAAQRLTQWSQDHPEEWYESIEKMQKAAQKYWQTHPQEQLLNMQKVNEGKMQWQKAHPIEHQKQVNEWRQKGTEANSKPVYCSTTKEFFPSASEAGRHYNIPQANISKALRGERKSAGKHPKTGEKMFWQFISKEQFNNKTLT